MIDSVAGGGRVAGYDLFASAADYSAYMADGVDAGTEPDGNLATGAKWERIRMTYDAFGRVLSTTHTYASGATAGQPTTVLQADTWTNSYDDQGRLVQETSQTGVIGYEYNDLGRKTRTWAGGVGATASSALSDITYDYDELGRLKYVNTVKRDGAVVDGNGAANGTPPETTTYHYDLLSRPDYTEMPNEVVEDYTFDNMDRLDVMRHFKSDTDNSDLSNNQLIDIFDYSYRADGKRTGLTEKFGGSGVGYQTASSVTDAVLANTYTWSYDNAGRLSSEILDSSDNTVDQTESYIMDLAGNRIRRTIDKTGTGNDVTDIYNYDSSDRLQSENRYAGLYATGTPAGSATQTTSYVWNATQQSSKTVSVPSVSSVVQSMSYGLTGQLEKVITTNSNGSGTVQSRVQVEYRYDNSGIRFIAIDTNDTNLGTTAVEGSSTGRTEYLIDHANFTGYAQTIIETTRNASGVATKRISYTFGADEITQTASNLNPDGTVNGTPTTLVFGHDGHGSTAVLFGAAATIAQIFTYSAYGELLSIHNNAGTSQALNSALTSILYNGEGIDSRTGLYNFRARWYSPTSGRFADRLDPFGGNPNDPFSFNKYGFVHSNPVMMTDPTGKWTLGNVMLGMTIIGAIGGISFGAYSNSAGAWWEGFIPGWGAGRGLGKAIRNGDPWGIAINTVFLGLDLLTFGGASWLGGSAKAAPTLAKGISKEALETLYQSLKSVAESPLFRERVVKAGLSVDDIPKLLDRLNDYYQSGKLGYPASNGVLWVDETIMAITKSAQGNWGKLAHELTHVLDDVARGVFSNSKNWWTILSAEYRAFLVQTNSKMIGAGGSFFTLYANIFGTSGTFYTIQKLLYAEADALGLTDAEAGLFNK